MRKAFWIFRQQIKKYKPLGLAPAPFKYFFRWKSSMKEGANSINDQQPWITFNAIDYLKKQVNQSSKVFEYGGGGSTLFFLKHGAEVKTVEHNAEWYKKLEEEIKARNHKTWKGFFTSAEKRDYVTAPNPANPEHYSTADEFNKGNNFKNYASAIDQFVDNSFDVVLVDGRSRPACIVHALPKIKINGILVLDNSDRKYYLEQTNHLLKDNFKQVISGYAPSPYSYDFTHTSIWIKKT